MKTKMSKLFLLAIVFWTPHVVQAASSCSYSEQAELNNIVANVKANYEVVDIHNGKAVQLDSEQAVDPEIDVYIRGFKISILNVTEDIYVTVKNDYDNEVKTYYNRDSEDGIVSFETKNNDKLINYTIEVHANKYSCAGQLLRIINMQTPVYNVNSEFDVCNQYKEFYYCQEFLPSGIVDTKTFFDQLEKYKQEKQQEKDIEQEKNKSFLEKIKGFYNNNKLSIYIVGGIVIITGVTTTAILVKRKRSRVL